MAKKQSFELLFIVGVNNVGFSYREIKNRAINLIEKEMYPAGEALQKVYTEITNASHLKSGGINKGGFIVYPAKEDYEQLSRILLSGLRRIRKKRDEERRIEDEKFLASDHIQGEIENELKRGVDQDVLDEIGY
jgi:hypothetical protein